MSFPCQDVDLFGYNLIRNGPGSSLVWEIRSSLDWEGWDLSGLIKRKWGVTRYRWWALRSKREILQFFWLMFSACYPYSHNNDMYTALRMTNSGWIYLHRMMCCIPVVLPFMRLKVLSNSAFSLSQHHRPSEHLENQPFQLLTSDLLLHRVACTI